MNQLQAGFFVFTKRLSDLTKQGVYTARHVRFINYRIYLYYSYIGDIMKYKLVLFLSLLTLNCSDDLTGYQGYESDFRSKSYSEVKHVGATCNAQCIYSSYAVSYNIQEKQYDCVEGPCACVKEGNAHTLCSQDSKPENLWIQQEDVQTTTENQSNQSFEVPYYNQYDNRNHPSATCQNTSVAMVLSYFQYNIHPDEIFSRWGKDTAQTPSGLNYVYSSYAANSTINTYTNASPEDLTSALSQGYIAIVHGYFTSYGHVLVVRGYDSQYYYVNDPAGNWDGCFKCGYTSSDYNGIAKYPRKSFENAVFTSNGSSYLPGWIHLIKGN